MRGRAMLTHGEVIAALVANRLCGPAPLYDVAGWASVGGDGRIVCRPSGIAQRRPARPGAGGAGPGGRAGARRARPGRRVTLLGGPVAAAPGHDRGPVHRRLHRLRAGRQGVGRRPHHRPAGQDHAGVHPRRGRGLLPAASGGVQRGAVLHRRARAHPRAGPARRGLRHRLRVRAT